MFLLTDHLLNVVSVSVWVLQHALQVCHTAQRGRCHVLDVLVQSALCCLQRRCLPHSSSPCPLLFTDTQCFHFACLGVHSNPVPILHLQAENWLYLWWSLHHTLHLYTKHALSESCSAWQRQARMGQIGPCTNPQGFPFQKQHLQSNTYKATLTKQHLQSNTDKVGCCRGNQL